MAQTTQILVTHKNATLKLCLLICVAWCSRLDVVLEVIAHLLGLIRAHDCVKGKALGTINVSIGSWNSVNLLMFALVPSDNLFQCSAWLFWQISPIHIFHWFLSISPLSELSHQTFYGSSVHKSFLIKLFFLLSWSMDNTLFVRSGCKCS
jgi:hypothetical protein